MEGKIVPHASMFREMIRVIKSKQKSDKAPESSLIGFDVMHVALGCQGCMVRFVGKSQGLLCGECISSTGPLCSSPCLLGGRKRKKKATAVLPG